jgi:hypothetical protein
MPHEVIEFIPNTIRVGDYPWDIQDKLLSLYKITTEITAHLRMRVPSRYNAGEIKQA